MITIYRVCKVNWRGEDVQLRTFLDNTKAQSYARQCENLNKIEPIVIRTETAHQ